MGESRTFANKTFDGIWRTTMNTFELDDQYEPVERCQKFDCWVASGYEAVREVLRDTETFSYSREVGGFLEPYHTDPQIKVMHDNNILVRNGEDHRMVQTYFHEGIGQVLSDVGPLVAEASELVLNPAELAEREVDLFREWSLPVSEYFVSKISGIPFPWPKVCREVRHVISMVWDPFVPQAEIDAAKDCYHRFFAWLDSYKKEAGPKFLWAHSHAQTEGMQDILPSSMWAFIFGATHTVPMAVCDSMYRLWEFYHNDRERYESLTSSDAAIKRLINEVVRLLPPGTLTYRYATRSRELFGKQIKKGELVVVNYVFANRDEAIWDAPHEFRPERTENPHLSFSYGPHTCVGRELGLAETLHSLRWFLPQFPNLQSLTLHPKIPNYALMAVWKPSHLWGTVGTEAAIGMT